MIEPYFQNEHATIYCGDCAEILPQLAIDSVDLILTDPPYGINYESHYRTKGDKLRRKIANDADAQIGTLGISWPKMLDLLKSDRHWYVFGSPKRFEALLGILKGYKSIIAWDKGDCGTLGDLKAGFGEAWEAIIFGQKGRRPFNGKRPRNVMRLDWQSSYDPLHPIAKPVGLLRELILMSTHPKEVVIDPYMGSGTTLRAAYECGRKSIGIEISKEYCDIAIQRLRQRQLFTTD